MVLALRSPFATTDPALRVPGRRSTDLDSSTTTDPAAVTDVGELYRQYAPMVLRRVRRFFGPNDAEEVVHEIFLRVMERLDGFRGASSPVTWLFRVTTNHCLNRLRDRDRRRGLLDRRALDVPGYRVSAPAQEATVFLAQLWRDLDPELVQVGIHYHVDGLTHDEIARILGVSPRTVGNRLSTLARLAGEAATPRDDV